MPGASVLLLTGPAGAGKTTVGRLLAARCPSPAAQVSLDEVRYWVRSGFADPVGGWSRPVADQLTLARRICAGAARHYTAAGISCVVDDAVFPDWPEAGLDRWLDELDGCSVDTVVLFAGMPALRARNAERSGHRRLPDPMLVEIHRRMQGWRRRDLPVVDCDDLTAGQVADRVAAAVAGRGRAWA